MDKDVPLIEDSLFIVNLVSQTGVDSAGSRHLALETVGMERQVEGVAVVAEPFGHGVVGDRFKGWRHFVRWRLEKHVL